MYLWWPQSEEMCIRFPGTLSDRSAASGTAVAS